MGHSHHCVMAAFHSSQILLKNSMGSAGEALYLGNSMPIRDMDMYAQPSQTLLAGTHSGREKLQGTLHTPVGARVAANRGASGIDGVLSTAAGYAVGLQRSVTLVVGDVSFVHDSNGLSLLRSGMDLITFSVCACLSILQYDLGAISGYVLSWTPMIQTHQADLGLTGRDQSRDTVLAMLLNHGYNV